MALMHGKVGKIQWDAGDTDTNLALAQSWSADVTHDVAEITSMQDTWETFLSGHQDWTATVECLEDSGGPLIGLGGDDGMGDDECILELYFVWDNVTPAYRCIYGTAICTGVSPTCSADGIPTITYTFQGVDQVLWYTSAIQDPQHV